jgi:hypothetical protein
MTKELKTFLRKHKSDLKWSALEKAAKLPLGTLSLVVNDHPSRHLSEAQEERVKKALSKLKDSLEDYLYREYCKRVL